MSRSHRAIGRGLARIASASSGTIANVANRMATIDFRLVDDGGTGAYRGGCGVEVVIDGRTLSQAWYLATGQEELPVPLELVAHPGHRLWRGDPPLDEEHGTESRRVVLVCNDGLTGCGGATACITVSDQTVTWSDFRTVPDDRDVSIGPFAFERRQYEQRLATVEARDTA
jgi:hypothetical protein